VPDAAWLTQVRVDATAANLSYDLAIDPTGTGMPSRVDAGWELPSPADVARGVNGWSLGLAIGVVALGIAALAGLMAFRPGQSAAR
jgi:hypothetical protein